MKRAVLILAICLLPGLAAAVLVDDFDDYSTGVVNETGTLTNGVWFESPSNTTDTVAIAVDPTDAGNQVLGIRNNADQVTSGQVGTYGILTGGNIVAQTETKTLFFRVYPTSVSTDTAFGFAADNAPTGWANMPAYCAFVQGNFRARNAAANTNIGTFAANTWYYVWLVVNNAANTYDVYFKSTAADATTTDRVATNFVFRTGAADGDLDRLFVMCNNGSFNSVSYYTTTLYIDTIHISAGTDLSLPSDGGAFNPIPGNGATHVALDTTLSWSTGLDPDNPANPNPAITKHYVYMRQGDPNLKYVTPFEVDSGYPTVSATATCSSPLTLAVDQIYYWRVDEGVNGSSAADPNTITGSVWSFNAVKSIPVITLQPKDAVAGEGESAEFSIGATVVGTLKYTWYYSTNAITDDGDSQRGTDANTLTFNAALGDEGYYYCKTVKVGNEANPVTSNVVKLGVKRPMAHWALDALDGSGNYDDSVGNHDADPNGAAVFVTGAGTGTNNGVSVSQTNRSDATAGTWNPSEMTGQFTFSLWAKWAGQTTPTTWQGLISKETSYGAGNMMWQLEITNAAAATSTVVLKNGLETGNLSIDPLAVGTWEHIVVTFNGTTATVYRNGVNAASGAWSMGTKIDAPVNIGISARSLTENLMFNGDMDDVQVWNYALTQNEVIDAYHAVTGKNVCTNKPTYDFDGDCLVTFADFASIASAWLTSGLYQSGN